MTTEMRFGKPQRRRTPSCDLQEVDRSGAEEAAAPQVRMRHFTAALQRVPPSVSARDRRLYEAMRSQVSGIQGVGF